MTTRRAIRPACPCLTSSRAQRAGLSSVLPRACFCRSLAAPCRRPAAAAFSARATGTARMRRYPHRVRSITEILSFPPASFAASIRFCRSRQASRSPATTDRCCCRRACRTARPGHIRYRSPGMTSCWWVSSSTVSSTPTARVTRFLLAENAACSGDEAGVDLLLQQRVIARDLHQAAAAESVGSASRRHGRRAAVVAEQRPPASCPCPRTGVELDALKMARLALSTQMSIARRTSASVACALASRSQRPELGADEARSPCCWPPRPRCSRPCRRPARPARRFVERDRVLVVAARATWVDGGEELDREGHGR